MYVILGFFNKIFFFFKWVSGLGHVPNKISFFSIRLSLHMFRRFVPRLVNFKVVL